MENFVRSHKATLGHPGGVHPPGLAGGTEGVQRRHPSSAPASLSNFDAMRPALQRLSLLRVAAFAEHVHI